MQIKELIKKLEALYSTYDDEYKSVMGEPEIVLDVFKLAKSKAGSGYSNPCMFLRQYAGFVNDIVIEKSSDGVYDVITAFAEAYEDQKPETPKSDDCSWPFPEGGEAQNLPTKTETK